MSLFICKVCKRGESLYMSQCPKCKGWNTFDRLSIDAQLAQVATGETRSNGPHLVTDYPTASEIAKFPAMTPRPQSSEPTQGAIADSAELNYEPVAPVRITDVEDEDLERTLTGIEPLDRVLGGGLVTASVVILGGEPGLGKSTLAIQAMAGIGERVLLISAEETIAQATMRARRVNATHPEFWIVPTNDVDEAIAHARKLRPSFVVVDSIHVLTCQDAGAAGSVSQIRESALRLVNFARTDGVTLILISHVTKDGAIAGPQTFRHLVDVVLMLEATELINRLTLRADRKNRFGSTQEVGVFEMTMNGLIPIDSEDGDAEKNEGVDDVIVNAS